MAETTTGPAQLIELIEQARAGMRNAKLNDLERSSWTRKLKGLLERYEPKQIAEVIRTAYDEGNARKMMPNDLGRWVSDRFSADRGTSTSDRPRRSVPESVRFTTADMQHRWGELCAQTVAIRKRTGAEPNPGWLRSGRILFVEEWVGRMRQFAEPELNDAQIEANVRGVCGDQAWAEFEEWLRDIRAMKGLPSSWKALAARFRAAMANAPESDD